MTFIEEKDPNKMRSLALKARSARGRQFNCINWQLEELNSQVVDFDGIEYRVEGDKTVVYTLTKISGYQFPVIRRRAMATEPGATVVTTHELLTPRGDIIVDNAGLNPKAGKRLTSRQAAHYCWGANPLPILTDKLRETFRRHRSQSGGNQE